MVEEEWKEDKGKRKKRVRERSRARARAFSPRVCQKEDNSL